MAEPVARDTLAKELQANGATVHTFDANATPEEKAARAGKARSQLQPVSTADVGASARAIKIDPAAAGAVVKPTVNLAQLHEINAKEDEKPVLPGDLNGQPPGAMAAGPAGAIPDWYKVGWRAVTAVDAPVPVGEQIDRNIIAMFISEMYYGEWYHNAGVIFFAVASTYFLTLFHLGWGWLFLVLATCATYYSNSIQRFRRAVRDDIQRELVKNRLDNEHESADWINGFLDRFWLIYEPVLSATIVSSVDQILSISTPPFLDSIRLSTFTLGTKAPRIEQVRTFPRTPDDIVQMNWSISFKSTDLSDLPPTHSIGKTSSKIVLEIKVGKGPARVTMPILVENIEFSGTMRIKLKLMTNFPHVQTVDISFLEKPFFSYVLKPIGGDTFGFDINTIPGLENFIRDMVHATLGPMMYDPNVFTLNLEQLLSGAPIDAATGVLQIHVQSARGLKGIKFGGGTPDPYVSLSINNRAEMARTKYKNSSYNPHFGSSHNILLNDANMTEQLVMSVFDHNDRRADSLLGSGSFDLSKLVKEAVQEGVVTKVLREGKDAGEIVFNVSYYPVLKAKVLEGGTSEPIPDTKVGIVRLVVHQAKELESSSRDLNPHAVVLVGRQVIHKTPTYKHTLAPVWESPCEFIVSDKEKSTISIKVIDNRDLMTDPLVGHLTITLKDLLASMEGENKRDWFPLSGAKSGRVRLSVEWKPLAMAGSVQGAAAYSPPIGVVRIHLQKATDLKNVEASLGGKSDPYVRVMYRGVTMARTEVINNNLNPEWDQIVYVPVHSLSEVLTLETMDYQHMTKDRSLGYVEFSVKDLARQNVDNREYPFESTGKRTVAEPLRLQGDSYKGKLDYIAEFIPAFNLKGVTFESSGTEMDRNLAGSESDVASGDQPSESSSDEEAQRIPEHVTFRPTPANGSANGNGNGSAKKHVKAAASADTTGTAENASIKTASTKKTNKTGKSTATVPSSPKADQSADVGGIELSREELFKHQSGVLVINAISGNLSKKARLELLLDEGYWPSFSSQKARSTSPALWDQAGEGFIKELDFAGIWLRLNENEEGEKEEIIGEIRMSALAFLDQCWNKESEFTLVNDRGEVAGKIKLMAKYVPVPVTLEPRESINNMGSLRVDVISAKDLRAADRGGKSDPYAQFILNGQKVFKSEVIKKTLTPVWDASFSVLVPSRVAADFTVEVNDWDQVGTSDELGAARINIADLEPMERVERVFPLSDPKKGTKGEIKLAFVFTPQIVAKSRKATSTFATAGRVMTQVGTAPIGATLSVAHAVGGVGSKAKGLFGGGKKEKPVNEADENDTGGFSLAVPPLPAKDPPAGQVSQPATTLSAAPSAFPSMNSAAPIGEGSPPRDQGTLRVVISSAKGLSQTSDIKPYVQLKLGKKEFSTKHAGKTLTPEWDEQFQLAVTPETESFLLTVFDHKTLGKDKHLGEADVDIWRHIQLSASPPITAADVWVELREGTGQVQLRLEFDRSRAPTSGSFASLPKTPLASPSRFSTSRRNNTSIDS